MTSPGRKTAATPAGKDQQSLAQRRWTSPWRPWHELIESRLDSADTTQALRRELQLLYRLGDIFDRPFEDALPAELELTAIIDQFADWNTTAEPRLREAVKQLLKSRSVIEKLAAPFDIRVSYWTDEKLQEAERLWRDAFDRILIGSDAELEQAEEELANVKDC